VETFHAERRAVVQRLGSLARCQWPPECKQNAIAASSEARGLVFGFGMQETFQKRERVEWQRSYKQEKGVEAATRTAERKLGDDSREEINAKRPQDGPAERTTVAIARKAPIKKGRPAQEYHPDADNEEEHLPHISKLTACSSGPAPLARLASRADSRGPLAAVVRA